MKTLKSFAVLILLICVLSGCESAHKADAQKRLKIGVMLSEDGLGDQSFNDMAFDGLVKARNKQGIIFDYKELADTGSYEKAFNEFIKDGTDLIIGVGFTQQQDMEKVAKAHPNQAFVLVDAVSDVKNITSLTFKEDEGSYLAGLIAGMKTKSNTVGFIGGADVPLIHKFANGFKQGVKKVNPDAEILVQYAGDFGKDELGKKIADEMIDKNADFIYPAAGFTGVGALKQAQARHVHAIGVDSDQYFLAEKAVVTSMMKRVDVAIYQTVKDYAKNGKLTEHHIELGLKDEGVELAPIRIMSLSGDQQKQFDQIKQDLTNGSIQIKAEK